MSAGSGTSIADGVEPSADVGMLMDGVIVDDGVDRLARGNLLLNDIEEANERMMAMALHVAADHRAVEDVHRGEQRRCAVSLIVVHHGAGADVRFPAHATLAVEIRNDSSPSAPASAVRKEIEVGRQSPRLWGSGSSVTPKLVKLRVGP